MILQSLPLGYQLGLTPPVDILDHAPEKLGVATAPPELVVVNSFIKTDWVEDSVALERLEDPPWLASQTLSIEL